MTKYVPPGLGDVHAPRGRPALTRRDKQVLKEIYAGEVGHAPRLLHTLVYYDLIREGESGWEVSKSGESYLIRRGLIAVDSG